MDVCSFGESPSVYIQSSRQRERGGERERERERREEGVRVWEWVKVVESRYAPEQKRRSSERTWFKTRVCFALVNATYKMFISSFSLLILPSDNPFMCCKKGEKERKRKRDSVMTETRRGERERKRRGLQKCKWLTRNTHAGQ
jgi:hypothetical protein